MLEEIHSPFELLESQPVFETFGGLISNLREQLQFTPQFRMAAAQFGEDRNAAVGAKPATAPMRGSVKRRQQTVFFALAAGVRLGVPVLGEQTRFTDIPFVLHSCEASRFVGRDADVLHDALFAETTVIMMYGPDFEVAVGAALAADEPAAQHTLMRTAPYDRME